MRQFTVTVTKCSECPFENVKSKWKYCNHPSVKHGNDRERLHDGNSDGLIPTCPMWPQAVDLNK